MKTQPHTPTPWRCEANSIHRITFNILGKVIEKGSGAKQDFCVAKFCKVKDAAFIVRAVNAHDALVEALESLFKHCAMVHNAWGDGDNTREANDAVAKARAALKLAKGE